jgi:hypothetical protein
MKKMLLLIFTILFAGTIVQAQDSWVSQKIDNRVSIKFPSQPTDDGAGSFVAVAPDSSVAYIFTLVDFAKIANLDSAGLAPIKATPEFAAQLKKGFKQSMPSVDLADLTIGTYKGFTSYSTSGFDAKKKRYDMFMFIIGTNFYSLTTVTVYGALLESRDKFFASITMQ